MKLDSWAYSIDKLIKLIAILIASSFAFSAFANDKQTRVEDLVVDSKTITEINVAQAQFTVQGKPTASQEIKLPYRWDNQFPGKEGKAVYNFSLPPITSNTPHAVFISRVGNQVEVRVGNEIVAKYGELGIPRTDSAKAPQFITIPAVLLSKSKATEVQIETTSQASRWGGLSAVYFGEESVLKPQFESNYRWRQSASVVICLALALMGTIAAGLWWTQRDILFGLFALTALFGIIRMGDRILPSPPIDWPLWGAITAAALLLHLLTATRFAVEAVDESPSWLSKAYWIYLTPALLASVAAFIYHLPTLWTLTLASISLPGFFALGWVVKVAYKKKDRNSIVLAVACLIVVIAGVYDFFSVRLAQHVIGNFSIIPHAIFVFVLFMAWVIVQRYSMQSREFKKLNTNLESRIAVRETELSSSYETLRKKDELQATMVERQRIMRDIHDGVGAQLVGLLNLIGKDGTSKKELEEHASSALDELRIAVDSLQPVEGDLVAVLATLRYRLQARLNAVGIEVQWEVDELPLLDNLGPSKVLQIQKILLETFTNILKHSAATKIQVTARDRKEPYNDLFLNVRDNGKGFNLIEQQKLSLVPHLGLKSMAARAQTIGAEILVDSAPEKGTSVTLTIKK